MSRNDGRFLRAYQGVAWGSKVGSVCATDAYQALTKVSRIMANGAWRLTVLLHQPRVDSNPRCCLASKIASSTPQRSTKRWTIGASGTPASVQNRKSSG